MEQNNVLTPMQPVQTCSLPRGVDANCWAHDNVLELSMCVWCGQTQFVNLGISERSLLEVAPRPFASLIVQLGHRFVRIFESVPQILGWAWGCIGQARARDLSVVRWSSDSPSQRSRFLTAAPRWTMPSSLPGGVASGVLGWKGWEWEIDWLLTYWYLVAFECVTWGLAMKMK